MKVILTGASGYIGGGVLQRCIEHPSITSILALSRRELEIKHPKLQTIIQKDFNTYEPSILEQLKGAQACIWCLGSYGSDKTVHVDLPVAALKAFYSALMITGQRFHFVYLSGGLCEKDQTKPLWFMTDARRMRGEAESIVTDFEDEHLKEWQSTTVRPMAVTNGTPFGTFLLPNTMWIPLKELAACMVDLVVNGSKERAMENIAVRERGKAALAAL